MPPAPAGTSNFNRIISTLILIVLGVVQVAELGVLRQPRQIYRADRAVSLLCHNNLGNIF
jgi:hypothetical protein